MPLRHGGFEPFGRHLGPAAVLKLSSVPKLRIRIPGISFVDQQIMVVILNWKLRQIGFINNLGVQAAGEQGCKR